MTFDDNYEAERQRLYAKCSNTPTSAVDRLSEDEVRKKEKMDTTYTTKPQTAAQVRFAEAAIDLAREMLTDDQFDKACFAFTGNGWAEKFAEKLLEG